MNYFAVRLRMSRVTAALAVATLLAGCATSPFVATPVTPAHDQATELMPESSARQIVAAAFGPEWATQPWGLPTTVSITVDKPKFVPYSDFECMVQLAKPGANVAYVRVSYRHSRIIKDKLAAVALQDDHRHARLVPTSDLPMLASALNVLGAKLDPNHDCGGF